MKDDRKGFDFEAWLDEHVEPDRQASALRSLVEAGGGAFREIVDRAWWDGFVWGLVVMFVVGVFVQVIG